MCAEGGQNVCRVQKTEGSRLTLKIVFDSMCQFGVADHGNIKNFDNEK